MASAVITMLPRDANSAGSRIRLWPNPKPSIGSGLSLVQTEVNFHTA
jgi:hypothetical protein